MEQKPPTLPARLAQIARKSMKIKMALACVAGVVVLYFRFGVGSTACILLAGGLFFYAYDYKFMRVQVTMIIDMEKVLIAAGVYTPEQYREHENAIRQAYGRFSQIRFTWLEHHLYFLHGEEKFYGRLLWDYFHIVRPGTKSDDQISIFPDPDGGFELKFESPGTGAKTILIGEMPRGYLDALQGPLSETAKQSIAKRTYAEAVERGEITVGLNNEFLKTDILTLA